MLAMAGATLAVSPAGAAPTVTVGSKAFAESWILGEALAAVARDPGGAEANHRKSLGGTEIVYQALRAGDIDAYVEYTGTIAQTILKAPAPFARMRTELETEGVGLSDPLGFEDSYALAASPSAAERDGLSAISDLRGHPDLRLGLTHEFLGRRDGFVGLSQQYGLQMTDVRGFQHELALEALGRQKLDITDVYTTDPEIEKLGLVVLKDDLRFFPQYEAVIVYRLGLRQRAPEALSAMLGLVGAIDQKTMTHANAMVSLDRESTEAAAHYVLSRARADSRDGERKAPAKPGLRAVLEQIGHDVWRHVELVSASLAAATLLGVPLGIYASRSRGVAAVALVTAGVVQTIPSLALLAFLIPLLGIGVTPALVALFIYSLLPIVRGTFTGLSSIPSTLSEAADAIGLPSAAKLGRVLLPMASPSIMAGIRTSAVINVGTATLAALIGAEGLGNPIMQGIALRDTRLILRGAVPAALLALLAEALFYGLERLVVPRGLRISSGGP